MSLIENIRIGIKSKGTIRDVSKDLGISEIYLGMLLNERRPITYKWKEKFADYLHCSISELEKGDFSIGINTGNTLIDPQKYLVDDNQNLFDTDGKLVITIPMLDIKASAGNGIMNFNDDINMHIVFDAFIKTTNLKLKESDVKANRYCFIQVQGDSMSPFLEDGNIALIDTEQNQIEQHKQVMVFIDGDGELYIKEMHKSYGGIYSIISYNTGYKSWENLTKEEYNKQFGGSINIIGTVIWVGGSVSYLKQKGGIKG